MTIGLDIGGTKVAGVRLDASGEVAARSWREHSVRGIAAVADELAAAVPLLTDTSADAVGVSVSGLVRRDGVITGGATLDLYGDLAATLSAQLARPVHVFNDAEATLRSVLDAHRTATGQLIRDAVLLTVGTGIGGAIVSDGRPVRGSSGLATELGHLPVRAPSAALCVCGSSGCLEQYAGGLGMAVLARQAVEDGRASEGLRAAHERSPVGITTKDVVDAAREGDPTAIELLEDAAIDCALAIRALCVTIEPSVIFLGGSVAHGAGDLLRSRIEHHLAAHWSFASLTTPPPVQLDSIGPYAAAIGAALLTRDLTDPVTEDPTTILEGTDND